MLKFEAQKKISVTPVCRLDNLTVESSMYLRCKFEALLYLKRKVNLALKVRQAEGKQT